MASLKNKVQKVEEIVEETGATEINTVETPKIQYMHKANVEKRPTLKAYFSALVNGAMTTATFTERENGEESHYGVLFQSRKYEDKDGKTQRQDYIHPIDKETRQAILDALLETFTKLFEGNFDVEKDVYEKDGVSVRYPREKNNFAGQVGDASIVVSRPMVMNNLELHEKDGKYFVAYPSRSYKDANGDWKNAIICGPSDGLVDGEINKAIIEAAVKAYQEK